MEEIKPLPPFFQIRPNRLFRKTAKRPQRLPAFQSVVFILDRARPSVRIRPGKDRMQHSQQHAQNRHILRGQLARQRAESVRLRQRFEQRYLADCAIRQHYPNPRFVQQIKLLLRHPHPPVPYASRTCRHNAGACPRAWFLLPDPAAKTALSQSPAISSTPAAFRLSAPRVRRSPFFQALAC